MATDCFQIIFDCLQPQVKTFKNQIGTETAIAIVITVIKMIGRKTRSKKVPKA